MVAHDKSIRMHRIDACTHPLYEEFRKLYRQSFPVFEQRTPPQQRDAFVHDAYRLLAYTENGLSRVHRLLGTRDMPLCRASRRERLAARPRLRKPPPRRLRPGAGETRASRNRSRDGRRFRRPTAVLPKVRLRRKSLCPSPSAVPRGFCAASARRPDVGAGHFRRRVPTL